MVLDEGGSGICRQRHRMCLYHCLRRYLLFPFCNASRCRLDELRVADHGWSFTFRSRVLVHQAEALCWAEGGGFGSRDLGQGRPLR